MSAFAPHPPLWAQDASRHNLLVLGVVYGLATWYDLVERGGRFLSVPERQAIYGQGMMSLWCFSALLAEACAA